MLKHGRGLRWPVKNIRHEQEHSARRYGLNSLEVDERHAGF